MVNSKAKKRDKSKEFHFHLVSRSLVDPLADIPGENQSVLQPFVPKNDYKKGRYPDQAPGTALGLTAEHFGFHENLNETEREQLQETIYGNDKETVNGDGASVGADPDRLDYFPRDGYDYERHLRQVGLGGGKILAAAGPGQQTDQGAVDDAPDRARLTKEERDAVDALEAAEAYDDADDDFFADLVADQGEAHDTARKAMFGDYVLDDSDEEDFDQGAARAPAPRGELDDAFDALLGEYEPEMLGALDDEDELELCGSQQIETFAHLLDEHIERPLHQQLKNREGLDGHVGDDQERWIDLPDTPQEPYDFIKVKSGPDFDCESVLSLRSNISNHPGKVDRPDQKKARPPKREQKAPEIPEDEEAVADLPEISTLRAKDETPEDRKARKAAVKEHQRNCRALKKETKEAFKEEAKKVNVKPTAGDLRQGIKHRPI